MGKRKRELLPVDGAKLLHRFIWHVTQGYVSAHSTSGPPLLDRVVDAFQRILDGEDPDDALDITRSKTRRPYHPHLPFLLYHLREVDHLSWKQVKPIVNAWLTKQCYGGLSKRALKDIYKDIGKRHGEAHRGFMTAWAWHAFTSQYTHKQSDEP
jgi:hypothetical protein